MPSLPTNCYRTPRGYIFRIVVPEVLRESFGKREFKKSLGSDYRAAVSEARLLAVQIDRQFNELRAMLEKQQADGCGLDAFLAKPADKRLKPITKVTPELISGIKNFWLASLEADIAWRRTGVDDEEYEDLQESLRSQREAVDQALARGRPEPFKPIIRQLLVGRGYDLLVSADEERELLLSVLPAIQQGNDILQQRQSGRLITPALDGPVLPAVWEASAPKMDGISWDRLIQHWKDDRERPAKTINDVERYIASLRRYLPKVTPERMTRAEATEWLRREREINSNSAKTLEKKGTLVGAVFSIAVKDELLEKNPFAGFDYSRFALKQGIEKTNRRLPFNEAQLRQLFSVEEGVYSIDKVAGGGGYYSRVWIPLLGLLTGARLDEIATLKPADVLEAPVPHIVIRAGKTQSSVREVPLHSKLIELGFLKYVDAVRQAGHASLWPRLRSNSEMVKDSEVLGRWFNRFIHDTLKMPSTVVFHSLRHTFKDMCRDALIPSEIHHALTGHLSDREEKNVGDSYGTGFSLETKRSQLELIKLPFDLPRPKPFALR